MGELLAAAGRRTDQWNHFLSLSATKTLVSGWMMHCGHCRDCGVFADQFPLFSAAGRYCAQISDIEPAGDRWAAAL